MKTLLSILTLVVIVVLCATGAFVTQTPNTTESLVVLSDADLSQRIGGKDKSVLETSWSGDMASCSKYNCPNVVYYYYPDVYRCEQCKPEVDDNEMAYDAISIPSYIKTTCERFFVDGDPRCDYISETPEDDTVSSCDNWLGIFCGD